MIDLSGLDWANVEPVRLNPELQSHLEWPPRAFVCTFSIPLDQHTTERLAEAIAVAVDKIQWSVMSFRLLQLLFGDPPIYAMPVGVGLEVYVADMSLDPIASASVNRIHLDAKRLAAMPTEPYDAAAVCILEELVHSWLNIREETLAKNVTAALYGGLVVSDGQYMSLENAINRSALRSMGS